jgi:hypothetical protein
MPYLTKVSDSIASPSIDYIEWKFTWIPGTWQVSGSEKK